MNPSLSLTLINRILAYIDNHRALWAMLILNEYMESEAFMIAYLRENAADHLDDSASAHIPEIKRGKKLGDFFETEQREILHLAAPSLAKYPLSKRPPSPRRRSCPKRRSPIRQRSRGETESKEKINKPLKCLSFYSLSVAEPTPHYKPKLRLMHPN